MSRESIKNPHTSDLNFALKIIGDYRYNSILKLKGICLRQDRVFFLHTNIVNLYISWKKDAKMMEIHEKNMELKT